jgi:mannose-6-phosphate isomerase-like protein (cupin superfamily)
MTNERDDPIIKVDQLPSGENSEVFNGHEHRATVSVFLSHNRPNTGPTLHKHPYEDVFIVQEGDVLFTLDDSEVEATGGDVIVVPPNTPHKFLSRGETHRQVSIHPAPRMETEWLE